MTSRTTGTATNPTKSGTTTTPANHTAAGHGPAISRVTARARNTTRPKARTATRHGAASLRTAIGVTTTPRRTRNHTAERTFSPITTDLRRLRGAAGPGGRL